MAYKAYVYAIYPNKEQAELCQKTFGCCRFVYNQMLSVQQERYKNGEKHLSKLAANTYCTQHLKTDFLFLKEVDKYALTNAIFHLADGFDRFFKKQGGYPKYKKKHKAKKTYTTNFTHNNIEIGDDYVKLPKLGKVKAKIHRKPNRDWKLKSATITQNRDNTYQVSALFEYETEELYVPVTSKNTLGLDYKSDGLYVDSNGNDCDMSHYYRLSQDKLAKSQRKLRHKTIGSNNYRKQQKKIAKIYRHIANQRKDFLHKKSTEIANQYTCVCVENLNMRSMANKGFGNGKATLDNGYGMFVNFLEYKLKDRGGYLVKVDKWFPSSQLCHWCGYRNESLKDLKIRKWDCPHCGHKGIDRDWNAAINIKAEGLRILESA
ncbi:RNA-guided endonuclease TnpB family protein [Lachnospiraceae bacterium YH-ros2228]